MISRRRRNEKPRMNRVTVVPGILRVIYSKIGKGHSEQ